VIGPAVKLDGGRERAARVVGEVRRHLHRDPSVDPVGAFVDAREQVSRLAQVVERDLEEGLFRS
jgi:hypothetical protein